ncbi:MAG: dTMP kinase, partial [Actinomycetota bacterium]|nr:dTMP kinase [Actinomycetota bacterium]
MRGRLVVLEGGEACGKSTQASLLAPRLGAVLTREPGGTKIGERIRDLVLEPASGELHARTEALLMAAARAQHVAEVVAPTLGTGRD